MWQAWIWLWYSETLISRRAKGLAKRFAITRFRYIEVLFLFTINGVKKIVRHTEDFVIWRFVISRFHCNQALGSNGRGKERGARERHTREPFLFCAHYFQAPATQAMIMVKQIRQASPLYRSFWKRPEHAWTHEWPHAEPNFPIAVYRRRVFFSFQSLLPIQTILCTYTS